MTIQYLLIVASIDMLMSAVVNAAPVTYVCPQSIPAASIHLVAPGPEWMPFMSSPLYLHSAAPADGPPAQMGVLQERSSTKTKAGWTDKYVLEGPYPDGKWLRCDYGSFGSASLAKRLPDTTHECTVTGKKGKHAGENQIAIQCL